MRGTLKVAMLSSFVWLNRGVNRTRATMKVPTHRATPPPPLRMGGLLKRSDKKPPHESATPTPTDEGTDKIITLESYGWVIHLITSLAIYVGIGNDEYYVKG